MFSVHHELNAGPEPPPRGRILKPGAREPWIRLRGREPGSATETDQGWYRHTAAGLSSALDYRRHDRKVSLGPRGWSHRVHRRLLRLACCHGCSGHRLLIRLYVDKHFLKQTLREWGVLAPVIFVALQALQVIIAPIPGEVTGILAGFLFGEWLGFVYSTLGLTLGSVAAFGVGRWLGGAAVRRLVSAETWNKLGFIVEAEGVILCFIIYLIPGLPKDMVCYLFGMSPMPLWVFAVVSTIGRIPDTWVLSAQDDSTTPTSPYAGSPGRHSLSCPAVQGWSLTSLQQVFKAGGVLCRHAVSVTRLSAEMVAPSFGRQVS